MKSVKVRQDELLKTLKSNRERHVENHAMASADREIECRRKLKEFIDNYADPNFTMPGQVPFPKVESHEADYNRAIRMVEMSVNKEIELDEKQFDQLVMDSWHWQHDFMRLATAYSGGKLK